jgi:hypothetical protein
MLLSIIKAQGSRKQRSPEKKGRPHLQHRSPRTSLRGLALLAGLLGVLVALPAYSQDVEVHGFISQGYLKTYGQSYFDGVLQGEDNPQTGGSNFLGPTKRGSWEFAEVGINFGTSISDDMRVGLQLFARDLGQLGNFQFELDWAFADYAFRDNLNFRLGRIKMPYGLYGEYRDLDIVRPSVLLPQSVYFEALRDLQVAFDGVEIYGNLDPGSSTLGHFDYTLFGGAIMGPAVRSKSSTALFFNNRAFYTGGGNAIFAIEDNSFNPYMIGGSLQWNTPWEGLLIKSSTVYYKAVIHATVADGFIGQLEQIGQLPSSFSQNQQYKTEVMFSVGSIEYTLDDLVLAAEYARYYGEFHSNNAPLIPHTDLNQERYYLQASYRLSELVQISGYYGFQRDPRDYYRRFPDRFLGRKAPPEVNTAPTGWDQAHPGETYNYETEKFDEYQSDYSLAVRFDVNDFWVLKCEGHLMHGTEGVYMMLNPNHPEGEEWWYLFALKSTMVF